jgi:retron-type reverse transcriptase
MLRFNRSRIIVEYIERKKKTKIKDGRFTELIRKSLKAGYFEFISYSQSLVGTPQGSIISPILANLYLHRLDEYVIKLKAKFDIGHKASINPEWKRLSMRKAITSSLLENLKLHTEMLKSPRPLQGSYIS